MIDDEGAPFSCPVCFERYDDSKCSPCTLPCGHSCCLSHIHSPIRVCCICRSPVPPLRDLHVSFALRDGSLLYWALQDSIHKLCLKHAIPPPVISKTPSEDWLEADCALPPRVISKTPSDDWLKAELEMIKQMENDEALARRMQEEENASTIRTTAPSPPWNITSPIAVPEQRALSNPHLALRPTASSTFVAHPRVGQIKSCGHLCSFTSLQQCCACMDKRPVKILYPKYVDGKGWVDIAPRDYGYCPVCKHFK
jgi:hypothetical protein